MIHTNSAELCVMTTESMVKASSKCSNDLSF